MLPAAGLAALFLARLRNEPPSHTMSASASVDAECPSSLRHVEEAGELEALVQRVVASGGQDAGTAFPRFAAIVSRCLEWSVVGVSGQSITLLV